MRRTLLKWLLLVSLLAYAVSMTVWASRRAASKPCPGIEIHVAGATPAIEASVRHGVHRSLAAAGPIKGMASGSIPVKRIEDMLRSLPNLEDAQCAVGPDGRLIVEVEALVPEMRVFGPGGASYYVNRQGKRMTTRADFFTDVPIVAGRFSRQFPPTALLPLVRRLAADPAWKDVFTMIEVRSPSDIILQPRMTGHVVNFGDTSRMDEKLRCLKAFYHKVMPYKGWNTYEQISVKFRGQVVATLRNKPQVPELTDTGSEVDPEEAALAATDFRNPEPVAPAAPASQKKQNTNP